MSAAIDVTRRWALVAAHPGDELSVFGWAELTRPVHSVLTDGSGRDRVSRFDEWTEAIDLHGLGKGALYGEFSAREFYEAVLAQETEFFLDLARRLGADFRNRKIEAVVSNEAEGQDPIEDLARFVAAAAVSSVTRAGESPVQHYVFSLLDDPGQARERSGAIEIVLTPEMFERKLQAVRRTEILSPGMPSRIARWGTNALRIETISPAEESSPRTLFEQEKPFYEGLGARRVAQGQYGSAIRYREHILPLMIALLDIS